MKTVTITIQNACTTGKQLMEEIRAVIPTADFIAINTIPADVLRLTADSVVGLCYLNYMSSGVRPENNIMVYTANYWHPVNTNSTINVPAGTVFKTLIVDYNW